MATGKPMDLTSLRWVTTLPLRSTLKRCRPMVTSLIGVWTE